MDNEQQKVVWTYYNPESDSSGQYVENIFDYDLILEVANETKNYDHEEFFAFLLIDRSCKQYLIDRGSEHFEEYDKGKPWGEPAFIGESNNTRKRLIAAAREFKFKTKTPAAISNNAPKKNTSSR